MSPLLVALALVLALQEAPVTHDLMTVAERSGFTRTARHAEVLELVDALVASSPLASRATLGTSVEGRELPLLIVADPPVTDAASARAAAADGKLVVFAFANIHAGEVCGKEALPILVRELLATPDDPAHHAWLERLVMVFAPIYNADGNERFAADNRPGQDGPDEMGVRPNAMGLDLNRDYMKLEAPETRAMVRFLQEWDPQLVMDLHTTNGSLHRYDLTWAPPLNPAGPAPALALVRDRLLPDVAASLRERAGIDTFPYGNFEDDHGRWATYSSLPRFGAQYHGLRGHLSVLSEAYSKVSYERRVVATREFVAEILSWTAAHAEEVRDAYTQGRADVVARGQRGGDLVAIRHAIAASAHPVQVKGWEEIRDEDGGLVEWGAPRDRLVEHFDHFEPVAFVRRPLAYLVPAAMTDLLEVLALHGIASEPWPDVGDAVSVDVEVYRLDAVTAGENAYLGHGTPDVSATPRTETRSLAGEDGWVIVPTSQPLGTLVVHLLEPEAEDALAPVLMGEALRAGEDYAVLRVMAVQGAAGTRR
jgi:dipeptidyl-peptidase-4